MSYDSVPSLQKVKEIQEIENKICNEWEIGFLKDMHQWLLAPRELSLSSSQKEVVDKLYEKACAFEE